MNDADPFAKARPRSTVTTNEMPESTKKEDPFAKARPQPESWGKFGTRIAAQTIARPIEAIGTIPGNLMRFVSDYGITAAEGLVGKDLSKFREALEGTAPYKFLPSSEQGKKATSSLTGGLTEPKGELEKAYNDVLELGTLLTTAAENPTAWQSLAKSIGLSASAVGSKHGAKALGFGETAQAATELGTLVLGSMYRPGAIQAYLGEQFNKLRSSPIAQRIVPTDVLKTTLADTRKKWTKGGTDPEVRLAIPKLEELEKIAEKGHVEVDELLEAFKKVNAEIRNKDLFDKVEKPGRKLLRDKFDNLKTAIGKNLEKYTPKDFFNEWANINQGYSTYARSRAVADWVNRNKSHLLKSITPGVVADLYFAIGASGPALLGAAGAFATKEIGEVMARISRSPTLRKYYLESLEHMTKENGPAVIKSIKKLQNAMEKEESKSQ